MNTQRIKVLLAAIDNGREKENQDLQNDDRQKDVAACTDEAILGKA